MGWKNRPRRVTNVIDHALPGKVAHKMPPPGLASAWRELVGPLLAPRVKVVCLDEDGSLVVAVNGSAFRQELALAAPRLKAALERQGFQISGLRFIAARTQAPPPPPPAPPEPLSEADEATIKQMVEGVRDPEVRRALAKAMAAQFQNKSNPS